MLVLTLLLQLASAPPVPRPPEESLAAAVALWADHPPSPQAVQLAIDAALSTAASDALARIGMRPSPDLAVTERYLGTYDRLKALIAPRLPQDRARIDRAVAECAVDEIARLLSPAEIAEVRGFMATPAGGKFWDAAGLNRWPLNGCYRFVLDLKVTDADYRALGLKPPRPPKPLPPGSTVYG